MSLPLNILSLELKKKEDSPTALLLSSLQSGIAVSSLESQDLLSSITSVSRESNPAFSRLVGCLAALYHFPQCVWCQSEAGPS